MPISIEEAIARVPHWAQASSLAVAVLPGGITNRNYRVDVDGEAFAVRLATTPVDELGIDRYREYRCTLAASQSGVAPEVICFLPDVAVLVTRYVHGHCPSAEEMRRPETIRRVVDAMHRYRAGPRFEGSFSPFRVLTQYRRVARRRGAPLPVDVDVLYRRLAQIQAAVRRRRAVMQPCHNDLWQPNLIDDGLRIHIVDWEYAGMGDVYFDLANFAMHHQLSDTLEETLLQWHFGAVTDAAMARLKLMRVAAELREGMWCMVGMTLLPTEFDFAGYAATHFDRCRRALDEPRFPQWLAQAATDA